MSTKRPLEELTDSELNDHVEELQRSLKIAKIMLKTRAQSKLLPMIKEELKDKSYFCEIETWIAGWSNASFDLTEPTKAGNIEERKWKFKITLNDNGATFERVHKWIDYGSNDQTVDFIQVKCKDLCWEFKKEYSKEILESLGIQVEWQILCSIVACILQAVSLYVEDVYGEYDEYEEIGPVCMPGLFKK